MCYTPDMTEKTIRKKFPTDNIIDTALSIAREKAGGEEALIASGASNITESTMEEIYLMGWTDAMAQAQGEINPFPSHPVSRDKITKPLKEGEIDRDSIENAKDIKKLDICVLGLSKRVYYKLQAAGIQTIGELSRAIDTGLDRVRGIGQAASKEIMAQAEKAKIPSY